jgi:hypothetical protein
MWGWDAQQTRRSLAVHGRIGTLIAHAGNQRKNAPHIF